ncbi:MAG: hypothetical protein ACYTF3_09370 [Planctomycetota bacterium]|jgi:hypothetical protein
MRFLLPVALLTLLPACASGGSPYPLGDSPEYSPQLKGQDWLRLAERAEARFAWAEAGTYLDRYAEENPEAADESFWFRRAADAERAGDPVKAAEVRAKLLLTRPTDVWLRIDLADDLQQAGNDIEAIEVLSFPLSDPADQLLANKAKVELLDQLGRAGSAASLAEEIALASDDDEARLWWQRASRLHEKDGDYAAATLALERALDGYDLAAEEQAVLARLRAFELGEPETVGDAVAVLRFHPDADKRLAALGYLEQGPFEHDIATFEMVLRDEDHRVARAAADELARRAPLGRTAALIAVADDVRSDARVVSACIRAIGDLGQMADVPFLLGALDPEDRQLFRSTRSSLEKITGQRFGLGLDPDLEERRKLREQWLGWWQEAAAEQG